MKKKINMNNSFNNQRLPNWLLFVLVCSLIIGGASLHQNLKRRKEKSAIKELAYSDVLSFVKNGKIKKIVIRENNAKGEFKNGGKFESVVSLNDVFFKTLDSSKVHYVIYYVAIYERR